MNNMNNKHRDLTDLLWCPACSAEQSTGIKEIRLDMKTANPNGVYPFTWTRELLEGQGLSAIDVNRMEGMTVNDPKSPVLVAYACVTKQRR